MLTHMSPRVQSKKLLLILLAVSLFPGLGELVENLEHLFHDGHLPHSETHETDKHTENHDQESETEHGCTPMSHQCSCHVSVPAVLAHNIPAVLGRRLTFEKRVLASVRVPDSHANAPPTPPPIA